MNKKIKILIWILISITILILGSLILIISIRPRHGEPYSRVVADMHQIQAKAKMIYEKERSYATLNCNYDDDMKMMCDYIEKKLGFKPTIHQSDKEYCAYIKLNAEEYFCIDSSGFAGKITVNPEKENYCDGRTFVCSVKRAKKEEVTLTTDKTEYEVGETLKIKIKNDTEEEKEIYILLYIVERFDGDVWSEIKRADWPCKPMYEIKASITLAPGQIIEREWDQKEEWCQDSKLVSQQVPAGKYRLKSFVRSVGKLEWEETICSNEFVLKEKETADWKTYKNEEYGFEFRYPEELDLKYIKAHIWPPKVTVGPIDPNFICEEVQGFDLPGPASKEEIIFNHSNYCVVTGSEGAMGSTYVSYKYITNKENSQLTLEFVLRFTNCGVYYGINNKMEECQAEISNFKANLEATALVDKILSTFRFLE